MNCDCDIIPPVQAALDLFPEKKRDNFDRIMDVAHLLMDGTVGTVCNSINGLFQTYALIQGKHDARKIVKYTSNLQEAKLKTAVEMRKLDIQEQKQWQSYDIQKTILTLYVEQKYQNSVDRITKEFQKASNRLENERYNAVKAVDTYTKKYMYQMDRQYQYSIREHEVICAVYRDFIYEVAKNGLSRQQLAGQIFEQAMKNTEKISDKRFEMIVNLIDNMTKPGFITFEDFVKMRNGIHVNLRW